MKQFDVVVIGAGHAGCEAALAAARLGAKVGLVTLRADRVAQMSCNPAIGGVGKGHLVKEVDALGGAMGRVADATGIQFRTLNMSRGPAVRSTRAQSDSARYREAMTAVILAEPNIELLEDEVVDLSSRAGSLTGVVTRQRGALVARACVVTTGTFLNGLCHVGAEQFAGGRVDDAPASHLSAALVRAGLRLGRFKTGTTPRLHRDSIAWNRLEEQPGETPAPRFSLDPVANGLQQVSCHITYTTAETHALIRANLQRSPLYQGVITGRGPRYCPSVEDKVVRFADKERHQIFLEPEGLDSERVYPNGLSTSLPKDVQEALLRSIPGLERCRVLQHGYAVEYDYAPPTQLTHGLMTKVMPGLFLAGQINGTSGYEEAAAQGLMAGVNAVRYLAGQESAVLGRDEAYIGVLIDDLVTKGVDEPYRIFTSRAEFRLTLRESNAHLRLLDRAVQWNLIDNARQRRVSALRRAAQALLEQLEARRATREDVARLGIDPERAGDTFAQLLRRPDVQAAALLPGLAVEETVARVVEEEIKYAGYIERERHEIRRCAEVESAPIPEGFEYAQIPGLSREAQEKLSSVRPATLGQASRIPGITPACVAILRVRTREMFHVKQSDGQLPADHGSL